MSERIRILIAIADLDGGGAQRQVSILVNHLSREEFEPHFCLWRPKFKYDRPGDIPLHMVKKTRPWHLFGAIRGMRRLIEEVKPHLIYSQMHYVNMVTGTALLRSRHKARWIYRQTGNPFQEMKGPFATWARWVLRNADIVIGPSKGISRAIVTHLKPDPERVKTVYNAVDIDYIRRLSEEPLPIKKSKDVFTVVHAGRLHKQKNQAMLFEAFGRFRGEPAELWMLGEGKRKGRLIALSKRLGIENQIRWLGFQSNPFPYLRAADCFVLSSDYEGLPNALIESMILGTPAVSTNCPFGPEELIEDGVTGFLVPVGDCRAMADALVRFSRHPDRTREMGRAASQSLAERFDRNRICGDYEALFKQVVAGKIPA